MKFRFNILLALCLLIFVGCVKDLDRDNPLDNYASENNGSEGKSGLFVEGLEIVSDNNGDLKVNKGESIKLSVKIKNGTSETINGVKSTISCSNEYVSNIINKGPKSFYNNGWGSSYDYINSGAWGTTNYDNYLEFDVSEEAPNDTVLVFDVKITDEFGHIWNDTFKVTVVSTDASLSFQSFTVESDNNDDSKVNKGESIKLSLKLQNSGASKANGIKAEISCLSPYVSNMINLGPKSFYNNGWGSSYDYINSGAWGKASYSNYLEFNVKENTPLGSVITFNVTITDETNNLWNDSFNIIVE